MATEDKSPPSFSPGRKWSIGLNVVLLTFFVFAVVVMANYLSRDYFYRFHLDTRAKLKLSPYTLGLLKSITNKVSVVLYYDQDNSIYTTVADLLNEYRATNPKITIQKVDYLKDPGLARQIQLEYKLPVSTDKNLVAKNLVIFRSGDHTRVVPGDMLVRYVQERLPNEKEVHMLRRPVGYSGEAAFNSALLSVISPKRLKAYFLTGHREETFNTDEAAGFQKFAVLLAQNNIDVEGLSLLGTNTVPRDCDLLVIAGPRRVIPDLEIEKVEQFLKEGGRLFTLFTVYSADREIGLEKMFARWGVDVGINYVRDPENSVVGDKSDIVIREFNKKHQIVNPFVGNRSSLQLFWPRTVGQLKSRTASADSPTVEELLYSGSHGQVFVNNKESGEPGTMPLAVAVEKGAIRGVMNERGTTRMVIAGDSLFLANAALDAGDNRDFAENVINWLLERSELVQGGEKPMRTYSVYMTKARMRSVEWILLGAFPGAVLLLGGLVWLRRRR